VTAGGVIKAQHGPAIVILHQYAYTGQGKTIHSSGQLEWYKNNVIDKSIKVARGLQLILTNDRYVIPISIRDGLPYVALHPFTNEEWDSLLHVILTGDADWDPIVIERGERCATVNGVDGHTVQDLPICTVAVQVQSNIGPIILIMHQHAYLGKGKTIHSSCQIEYYKNAVSDESSKAGGKQHIVTLDGYVHFFGYPK